MDKKKVLLVEDDRDFIDAVKIVFDHYNFNVITAFDGEEALTKAQICQPDVVVLDVMIPKKDGYTVCAELKENETTSHIPVLMLSSLGKSTQGKTGAEIISRGHGADCFLEKPVDSKLLVIKTLELTKDLREESRLKSKILIVDDDSDFVAGVQTILESHDFDVVVSGTGKEGIHMAASEKPDLILLDVMLPEMDGYAVCKKLKDDIKTQSIPVVLLTSIGKKLTDSEYAKAIAITHQADDYIEKPVEMNDLVKRIRKFIGPMHRLV